VKGPLHWPHEALRTAFQPNLSSLREWAELAGDLFAQQGPAVERLQGVGQMSRPRPHQARGIASNFASELLVEVPAAVVVAACRVPMLSQRVSGIPDGPESRRWLSQ
jgi:hypothetical protein